MTRRTFLAGALAAGLLALAGCNDSSQAAPGQLALQGSDITGTHLGRDLDMIDPDGKQRRLADYRGKVVIVFFGYTHCPDVCPTAMAQLAQTMELLGPDASRTQVLMITVDPGRDTPEILGRYARAFNPAFVGLTGSEAQLAATARSFRAHYAKSPGKTPDDYAMDHSSAFYVLDQNGEARSLLRGDATAADIAHDIRQILQKG